jgi:hypothetical protein
MNPVLNKELRRTGGRVLIRLGDQDVGYWLVSLRLGKDRRP